MDPKDLFDNSQNLDYALNDITKAIWTDRFGRSRKTYWGWEQESAAQLLSQQQRFNNFIQSSGYKVIGEYTAGPLTVTEYNQLIRYQNELYKLTADTPLPFTTTGIDSASWANDSAHFVSVGDAALRQELAAPTGAQNIGFTPYGLTTPTTVEDVLRGASTLNPERLGFFRDTGGANIHRLRDRGLIGDASRYTGNQLGSNGYGDSWIVKYAASWILKNSIFASSTEDGNAGIGLFGASRSGPGVTPNLTNAGVAGFSLCDGPVASGRAFYGEAMMRSPAGTMGGLEIQVGNYTSRVPVVSAYDMSQAVVNGLFIGVESGVGYTVGDADSPISPALNPAGAAVQLVGGSIGAAYQKWTAGIVMRDGALVRDADGMAIAMTLARKQKIRWEVSASAVGANIWSEVGNGNLATGLKFADRHVQLLGFNDRIIVDTQDDTGGAGAVNYPLLKNSRANSPIALGAAGSDTNITLDLYSQGSGQIRLMSHGATGENVRIIPPSSAPANYLTISASVSGNPVALGVAGTDVDTSLRLTPKGAGQIIVGNTIRPNSANAYTCGTSVAPWAGGFTQTAFTVTSDETHKTKPLDITDAMLDAAAEVYWVQYQYLNRVEEKGADGARWHFGAVAQRYVEAFERHGLDAHRFGFLCYDEWDDQYVKVQTNEGETVTKTRVVDKTEKVTRTRLVSRPVMVESFREVLIDSELEDGTRIKKLSRERYLEPKVTRIYIFNEDGTPHMENGEHAFLNEPVMEEVNEEYEDEIVVEATEEYEAAADPVFTDVLETPAGSRYGIRYEEALALEAALQRRNYERLLAKHAELASRLEVLEGSNHA